MNIPQLNIKVILVDDEASVLFALKLLLQALGYQVVDFFDPMKAVAAIKQEAPGDVVICDLRMGTINGLDVLKEIRSTNPKLPFILMSAHATDDEQDLGKSLGANAFLPKPFTPQDLHTVIAQVLGKPVVPQPANN